MSTQVANVPTESEEEFDTEALAMAIAEAAWEMKARNVRILDVRGLVSYTDFIVICHGTSLRHAQSIAEFVVNDLRPVKVRPLGREGDTESGWLLVDFGDAVLHVFDEPVRAEYGLESIYSDAPLMPLEPPADLEDLEAEVR
ncbi:MAG: ribosome-associated protein [Bradymonadia bacterium]